MLQGENPGCEKLQPGFFLPNRARKKFLCGDLLGRGCLIRRNWLAWSRLRQKSGYFLPDEADFCRP